MVMNSLLEKEGMAGQVQMVYIDPPYGIKYGSNFQPFVNKRDVRDGKDEDLTQEPEKMCSTGAARVATRRTPAKRVRRYAVWWGAKRER